MSNNTFKYINHTKEEIEEYLRKIKQSIKKGKFIVCTTLKNEKNRRFIEKYRLDSNKQKQMLIELEVKDFCYSADDYNNPEERLYIFCREYELNNWGILEKIEIYDNQGKSMSKIVRSIIEELKNIILYSNAPDFFKTSDNFYLTIKEKTNNSNLYHYIHSFSNLINEMKNNSNNKILLEIEIIKLIGQDSEENAQKKPFSENKMVINTQTFVKDEKSKNQEKESSLLINSTKPFSSIINEQLIELKNVRINNALVSVSQKRKNEFKEKLEKLKPLLVNENYSKFVSLLFDGELKAISNENLIFVYKTKLLADAFNLELINFEKIFIETFNKKYYPIAVSEEEWDDIKTSYNKNKKQYIFKEELTPLEKIFQSQEKNKKNEEKKTEIDDLFESFVEYE